MDGKIVVDQPGLEVAPVADAPEVVEGPIEHKPWGSGTHLGGHSNYQQTPPPGVAFASHHYSPPPPPSAGYVNSDAPQSSWDPSQTSSGYPAASEKPFDDDPRICGIKRRTFWLVVGPFLALLVIGLAVGLGVGLSLGHSSTQSSTSANSTSTSTASATSSAATSTPTVSTIICPGDNTTYYDTDDGTKFLVLCNLDFNSGGGSVDLDHVVTTSIDDCASTCANHSACMGAGWGNYQGTYYCWMKSTLGVTQSASNWYFVVKQ
ncbi:hypothetical protein BX600DRAFT_164734 [Xylariales sp. PMI_506]|nr:hypothetical protein BX600DRAFT_164734 [Xylariales sp. PMI_506]